MFGVANFQHPYPIQFPHRKKCFFFYALILQLSVGLPACLMTQYEYRFHLPFIFEVVRRHISPLNRNFYQVFIFGR